MPQPRGEPIREEPQQGEPPAPEAEPWAAAVPPVSCGVEEEEGCVPGMLLVDPSHICFVPLYPGVGAHNPRGHPEPAQAQAATTPQRCLPKWHAS